MCFAEFHTLEVPISFLKTVVQHAAPATAPRRDAPFLLNPKPWRSPPA